MGNYERHDTDIVAAYWDGVPAHLTAFEDELSAEVPGITVGGVVGVKWTDPAHQDDEHIASLPVSHMIHITLAGSDEVTWVHGELWVVFDGTVPFSTMDDPTFKATFGAVA